MPAGLTNSGAADCLSGPGLRAATRHLGLFVGDPSSGGAEVAAAGYARLARTVAQMPIVDNQIRIAMGEWDDQANASWGTPDHVGVFDQAAGGNLKWYVPITPAITEIVQNARVFTEAGDIVFTLTLS